MLKFYKMIPVILRICAIIQSYVIVIKKMIVYLTGKPGDVLHPFRMRECASSLFFIR